MTIDRIGYIDPILPGKRPGRDEHVRGNDKPDSVSLSPEALEKAEIYQVVQLIKAVPDIQPDRIAELKEKINDPSYLNELIIDATADNILDAFGL
jgi:negative regulator of flagellin synthesis FlgM